MRKKYLNRILAITMTAIMGFATFGNCAVTSAMASALKENEGIDGDLSLEEGAKEYALTEEDVLLDKEKMEEDVPLPFSVNSDFDIKFNMNCSIQTNNYYCGPATVKNVLHYINGNSKTQKQYATMLKTVEDGTDMSLISDVLNAEQNKHKYVYKKISNLSDWKDRVQKDTKQNVPVVMDIAANTENWFYDTNGHFLCTAGYVYNENSTDYVWICDPHPEHGGIYKVSAKKAFTVNNNHWRKAIIW